MKYESKTKKKLIDELEEKRLRIAELEAMCIIIIQRKSFTNSKSSRVEF